jgi:hypothetical protein
MPLSTAEHEVVSQRWRGQLQLSEAYRDGACVLIFELDDGLSAAGDFDLVLWAKTRHHCTGALASTYSGRCPDGKAKHTFNRVPAVIC